MFAILSILSSHFCLVGSRSVQVDVQAPWATFPSSEFVQISEYLGDKSADNFIGFINELCEQRQFLHECYTSDNGELCDILSRESTKSFIPLQEYSLLSTSVKTGMYLPRIRFFESLSSVYDDQCDSKAKIVVYPDEKVFCNMESAGKFLNQQNFVGKGDFQFESWEHALQSPPNSHHSVVLYGVIGEDSFCSLFDKMKHEMLLFPSVSFSLRHSFSGLNATWSGHIGDFTTTLSGYGVHLDIKNMEYVAIDDGKVTGKDDESVQEDSKSTTGEHESVKVAVTGDVEKSEITEDKAQPTSDESEQEKKARKISDLGFKTIALFRSGYVKYRSMMNLTSDPSVHNVSDYDETQFKFIIDRVMRNASTTMWRKFSDVILNFPTMAPSLANVTIPRKLREHVANWWTGSPNVKGKNVPSSSTEGVMRKLPYNSLFINGLAIPLDSPSFNIFDLLTTVKREYNYLYGVQNELFKSIEVSDKRLFLRRLQSLSASLPSTDEVGGKSVLGTENHVSNPFSSSEVTRIDVSRGARYIVHFINNLEKDELYAQWSRSVKTLLMPSWSLHMVAKNLYTVLGIVRPLSKRGVDIMSELSETINSGMPIRFGFVLSCSDEDEYSSVWEEVQGSLGSNRTAKSTVTNHDICVVYSLLRESHSLDIAWTFLEMMSAKLLSDNEGTVLPDDHMFNISIDYVANVYSSAVRSKAWPGGAPNKKELKKEVTELLSFSDDENIVKYKSFGLYAKNCSEYIESRGLPSNSLTLNGIVLDGKAISQSIMQNIGREQYIIAQAVQAKLISDKTKSIFNAILENSDAHVRYHPLLFPGEQKSFEYIDMFRAGGTMMDSLSFIASDSTVFESIVSSSFSSSMVAVLPVSDVSFISAANLLEWFTHTIEESNLRVNVFFSLTDEIHSRFNEIVLDSSSVMPVLQGVEADLIAITFMRDKISKQLHLTNDTNKLIELVRFLQLCYRYIGRPRSIEFLRKDIVEFRSSVVASFNELKLDDEMDAIRRQFINYLFARFSEDFSIDFIPIDTVKAVIQTLINNYKHGRNIVSSRTGSGFASSSGELSERFDTKVSYVLYDARVFEVEQGGAAKPIHKLDWDLFHEIESSRLSAKLQTVLEEFSVQSSLSKTLLTTLSSFCGSYSGSLFGKRYDIHHIMMEGGIDVKDSPFTVEIPATTSALKLTSDYISMNDRTLADDFVHLNITYLFNPLTKAGQRAASLFPLFAHHLQYHQLIMMIPLSDSSEFPLQNYFRFVLPAGDDESCGLGCKSAVFTDLPTQHTLTVRTDVPETWNVQSLAAHQDIDNLVCKRGVLNGCSDPADVLSRYLSGSVTDDTEQTFISYSLKNLVIPGQCFENIYSPYLNNLYHKPPSGLQVVLYPERVSVDKNVSSYRYMERVVQSDTLVMNNLGFFQLQANPGLWALSLAVGRARSLYAIDDGVLPIPKDAHLLENYSPLNYRKSKESLRVVVNSFADTVKKVFVNKRSGFEHIQLLDDSAKIFDVDNTGDVDTKLAVLDGSKEAKSDSLWGSLQSWLSNDKPSFVTPKLNISETEKIHVFSLATGRLYERLLRIMMLSVVKRSSMPVKFWLFENYLSPSFKKSANTMSAVYGFEIGYVTYKWPAWLTQQSEKQRIIWGYKILFLDVLFPISVKRIIYVDADQVVRADLAELWRTDLQGRAYGYVPFCSSRQETLGYQFWRQGFWHNHLAGRPYHISALYVVDLENFRRYAVGDILRSTYDSLARDPGSLANLDQDLPNFAQHQVPIFSLPQEWLWCESWCDDESKSSAKTIDLCNNPLHKEPKLDMARRIISGKLFNESWVELDAEIDDLLHSN